MRWDEMNEDRIKIKTTNLRFVERDGKKILQQQWRESDRCYVDWQGDKPKYWWEDIPVEEESIDNEDYQEEF